jgi:hypothetical protein
MVGEEVEVSMGVEVATDVSWRNGSRGSQGLGGSRGSRGSSGSRARVNDWLSEGQAVACACGVAAAGKEGVAVDGTGPVPRIMRFRRRQAAYQVKLCAGGQRPFKLVCIA